MYDKNNKRKENKNKNVVAAKEHWLHQGWTSKKQSEKRLTIDPTS